MEHNIQISLSYINAGISTGALIGLGIGSVIVGVGSISGMIAGIAMGFMVGTIFACYFELNGLPAKNK